MGKIFDALEKFSKERGATVSDRITDSDYEVLMQFDDATGRIDIENQKIARNPAVLKRLKTYRLINDDGTLTPAGRAKYVEMTRNLKQDPAGADAEAYEKQALEKEAQDELIPRKFVKMTREDWALLMKYDRQSGNLLKYDPDTGQLDEDSKRILEDSDTVQRLINNQAILPGGWLTPQAKRECARIEEKLRDKRVEDTAKPKKITTAETSHRTAAPAKVLGQDEMQALLDYDVKSLKLNMSNPIIIKEPEVVKRLFENKMIEPNGKLTPQALVRCRVLTRWKEELEQKKGTLKIPKGSIGEKLQSIAEKGKPRKTLEQDSEKKLKIIPLEKSKAEKKIETKTAAKKEEEKIPPKADDTKPAARARVLDDLPKPSKAPEKTDAFVTALEEKADRPRPERAGVPSERKFALGDAPAQYARPMVKEGLVTLMNPQSFEAEQFKILRTNLLFPESRKPPRTVMVTSALPGEGKSFVAGNLAISVARHVNWNVLLIDCDLRLPSIHRQFGFKNVPGLSDYLTHGITLSQLLLRTDIKNLSILPAGKSPDNPSELLSSERMAALLDEAATRYSDRLIIIDSPPPKLTAESGALARYVDAILLVVKYGSTPKNSVAELIDKLGKNKIIGAVVNNFDAGASRYKKKYYGGALYGK